MPNPASAFRAITVQFGEGRGCVLQGGGDRGYHSELSGRGDIQQNLEGGVHLGFVRSLAELGTEFIGQGFGTTSPLASVD